MRRRRIAVIGGGASGMGLAWLLTRNAREREELEVELFHDEPSLGGHSHTLPADSGGRTYPIDIGVQFISPVLYPHVFAMLGLPEFRSRVRLAAVDELRVASSFGADLNWGNFEGYRRGGKFERLAADEVRAHGRELERDIVRCFTARIGGSRAIDLSLREYFEHKPWIRTGDFFRFVLVPYLSIINGYTAHDLLETKLRDLFPLFLRLPFGLGPHASFERPSRGFVRFRDGAQSWVEAMADFARAGGATLHTAHRVTRVRPDEERGPSIEWIDRDGKTGRARFDEVVLTTDMETNRELLRHAENGLWEVQERYVGPKCFSLLPGVCFIHRDASVLSPHLRDGDEDVQFTGAHAWNDRSDNEYGLPYDAHSTHATHFAHRMLGMDEPCYVTMYAEAHAARFPDPALVLHEKRWRHGRWMSSFFAEAKERLHEIQGMGGVWYAGNNTTFDSEEGALLSAIGIAHAMVPGLRTPLEGTVAYARRPLGALLHSHFVRGVMFPAGFRRATARTAARTAPSLAPEIDTHV